MHFCKYFFSVSIPFLFSLPWIVSHLSREMLPVFLCSYLFKLFFFCLFQLLSAAETILLLLRCRVHFICLSHKTVIGPSESGHTLNLSREIVISFILSCFHHSICSLSLPLFWSNFFVEWLFASFCFACLKRTYTLKNFTLTFFVHLKQHKTIKYGDTLKLLLWHLKWTEFVGGFCLIFFC